MFVEYDLHCESIKSMRGQIVADFIVEHRIDKQLDGSACGSGCGVGNIIISPNGAVFEALSLLDCKCTNNQIEYDALLFGLQILHDIGVKHVEAYGDSLLVVQQVSRCDNV
jgi:ribonuclease HI